MEKVKDMLSPHERKDDEDSLYGKNAAGLKSPEQPESETIKSPLAQGHIQDDEPSNDSDVPSISAPADVTGMTGQYVTGRDPSPISDQERKKHGTAVGLASATMTSGSVGDQSPST
ncbi:hypothetical protein N0V93_010114 [Gnomoniopsis smithogilvyi]|uniref:Uncharacterized protein n=1 Tax=Gnomoniopsis smithogilvyi TaxID=1191159 RepID=A0A9W8YLQ8_9PEZI|nr:hypothetical protein N0V93_010114 [Gnomoniopsis smithogilvyi]